MDGSSHGEERAADDGPGRPLRLVVTGAGGTIGRRFVDRVAAEEPDWHVVAVDKASLRGLPAGVETHRLDLASADLRPLFAGTDVVVHLATPTHAGSASPELAALETAIARRVLDEAVDTGVGQVVVMSTAMVYGAWPTNPVPLTEAAPMRPNADLAWAVQRARLEELARGIVAGTSTRLCILRPTAIVADGQLGQLARSLHAARVGVAADADPPVQYVHVDDVAAAIVAVVRAGADGSFNVAPDGWIPPDELADLEGPRPRVRVPTWVARLVAAVRWRSGLAPTPPGLVAYTANPWVVANDRLRALGWEPGHTNEEAWVVSHDPGPLDRLPAHRRQSIALALAALGVAVVIAVMVAVVLRFRRGSRGRRPVHHHG